MNFEAIKKVAIWTTNPVKVNAVKNVFKSLGKWDIEFVSISAPSWVSDQPIWDEETIKWAYNRAKYCLDNLNDIDIAFGLEWSVNFLNINWEEKCFLFGWTVAIDRDWNVGYGSGNYIELPEFIWNKLKEGKELWPVMDEYLWMKNIKHWPGTIWLLTNWLIDRARAFELQVICSLTKWISDIWK